MQKYHHLWDYDIKKEEMMLFIDCFIIIIHLFFSPSLLLHIIIINIINIAWHRPITLQPKKSRMQTIDYQHEIPFDYFQDICINQDQIYNRIILCLCKNYPCYMIINRNAYPPHSTHSKPNLKKKRQKKQFIYIIQYTRKSPSSSNKLIYTILSYKEEEDTIKDIYIVYHSFMILLNRSPPFFL